MPVQKLVIVESPAKAKTINRFLGKEYKVVASMGHVRDLPETMLGIDLKNDFQPVYEESKRKQKILNDLRSTAKGVSEIYLAPDPDREGEAIAWHLHEILYPVAPKAQFFRVSFHEITASAIRKAFEHAGDIDMHLVDAQQARRVLDRLVGYQVSPLLWSSVERGRGISAGRVQSVALRLVVERERAIQSFIPEEFWNLWVELEADKTGSGKKFRGRFVRTGKEKMEIHNQKDAEKIMDAVRGKRQSVVFSDVSPRSKHPSPPFITSTLQQIAGSVLRFSTKQTMQVAQELYEGIDIGRGAVGLITYMRTDSVNVAAEAQKNAMEYIGKSYGEAFVPSKPNYYRSKSSAQEAHEAIRPTDVEFTPDMARQFLSPAQQKLYTLIWKRFIASQMASAQQRRSTVETQAEGTPYIFRAVATETLFPGYLRVFGEEEKQARSDGLADGDDEQMLPVQFLSELKEGETCFYSDFGSEQKFTEPPPRYSEATLVKELETNGIGRPSTYATIVNTIQDRKYVHREKGKLIPTDLGFRVNDYLVTQLSDLFQVGFTADMETKLDQIEDGKLKWVDMLHDFYDGSFTGWLAEAKHKNAPESAAASALIEAFGSVKKWEKTKSKTGSRSYDDAKFVDSIAKQFKKNTRITERQWHTLLRLAAIYDSQIPELAELAKKYGFTEALETVRHELSGGNKVPPAPEMIALLDAFKTVEFEAATAETRTRRAFDGAKFITSLAEQVSDGKPLSVKQSAALARLADRYAGAKPELRQLAETAGLAMPNTNSKREILTEEQTPEIVAMIERLNAVTQWAEPTKRGNRTFDDREFFESVKTQYEKTRRLSARQIAALAKMDTRYDGSPKTEDAVARKPRSGAQENDPQTVELIAKLETVTDWEAPKGRYDDKKFFDSLHRQYKSGKVLSEKQRDILFKMAQKYGKK